ncbi:MAG: DNA-formamidopyrimidine glycosylase [Bacillota bacterium]|jgi:formamidopyrimidine-DNA glycosylase|uniref:Formamidopyrimidine-DNA glycosylase n=1 Tax=Thermanaerosceptrum fracticalcis TaxID=1712410 RepID=A0A7G6DYG4_THEFR|nr:DNA-formamidopyrimidine glycosylase [Thermanaerosceptrum fracticalcis]QNB44868.1 DNA-formamidopyrimidine glycosylase [Thermanaerosceptrum fracticalcis]
MPELPEVETVKRSLEPHLIREKITGMDIYYGGIIKEPELPLFRSLIQDKEIKSLGRRGKYLLLNLSEDLTLVVHLRMTGRLTVTDPAQPVDKHTHLIFRLSGGKELRFTDVRKFGLVYLVPTGCWNSIGGLFTLGPEPLEEEFTLAYLQEKVQHKKTKLKNFLLDQRQIAGIGNIYADEILFEAGLHPERSVETLTAEEVERLYYAIRSRLQAGVEHRGTSFRDYVDGTGAKGGFQNELKAYGREGEPCERCGTQLVRSVVAGRGTVFCPCCQV